MIGRISIRWLAVVLSAACAATALPEPASPRIDRVNEAFLTHLGSLERAQAIAVATVREGWTASYRAGPRESFVPDSLTVLYPDFRRCVDAFDDGRAAECLRIATAIRPHADAFLDVHAAYFQVRSLIDLSRFEEAERELDALLGPSPTAPDAAPREKLDRLDRLTPYAPHLQFMRAYCLTRNLRYDPAAAELKALLARYDDAPESVAVGARQLLIELERRELGTLAEVSDVMGYVSDRLKSVDGSESVRKRQEQVIAMLDKLIQENEQKEQQQSQSGKGGKGRKGGKPSSGDKKGNDPSQGAEKSTDAQASGGDVNLHGAPKAAPGEVWGSLPPAEREKILQSIRERFPSRYRQLVEQYYRSLAEQK